MNLKGGGWTESLDNGRNQWVAAAAAHQAAPVMMMSVVRQADGSWNAVVEYRDKFGSFPADGFDTRSGAQAWCEQRVDALEDNGRPGLVSGDQLAARVDDLAASPLVESARKAIAEVDTFNANGLALTGNDTTKWFMQRGDVAMKAAQELRNLLAEIDRRRPEAGQ